jgi:hypothetical protein
MRLTPLALVGCQISPDAFGLFEPGSTLGEPCVIEPVNRVRATLSAANARSRAALALPAERTQEPCDGIDNDEDGFTDPHCGTVPCSEDAECTMGGLLPDADCNPYQHLVPGFSSPGCNQIDGYSSNPDHMLNDCWGVLCPEGLKCVAGDCLVPGTGAPCSRCTSGADCPLNSGCIPIVHGQFEWQNGESPAVCHTYCHDTPCPEGYGCYRVAVSISLMTTYHEFCLPNDTESCPLFERFDDPGFELVGRVSGDCH